MAAIFDLTLRVAHQNLWLVADDSGIRGMDGVEFVQSVESRYWAGRLDLPALSQADAMAARALSDQLRGRANLLRVTLCSDGAGWAVPPRVPPVAAAAAAVGASALVLTGAVAALLLPGAWFSVADHAYRIATNIGGAITFNPPLRSAVALGATVEVVNPTLLVRLEKSDGFRVLQDYCRNSRAASLDVVEVVLHG